MMKVKKVKKVKVVCCEILTIVTRRVTFNCKFAKSLLFMSLHLRSLVYYPLLHNCTCSHVLCFFGIVTIEEDFLLNSINFYIFYHALKLHGF